VDGRNKPARAVIVPFVPVAGPRLMSSADYGYVCVVSVLVLSLRGHGCATASAGPFDRVALTRRAHRVAMQSCIDLLEEIFWMLTQARVLLLSENRVLLPATGQGRRVDAKQA
jgi:hypothetical protein